MRMGISAASSAWQITIHTFSKRTTCVKTKNFLCDPISRWWSCGIGSHHHQPEPRSSERASKRKGYWKLLLIGRSCYGQEGGACLSCLRYPKIWKAKTCVYKRKRKKSSSSLYVNFHQNILLRNLQDVQSCRVCMWPLPHYGVGTSPSLSPLLQPYLTHALPPFTATITWNKACNILISHFIM
jgi:hypothetical protein